YTVSIASSGAGGGGGGGGSGDPQPIPGDLYVSAGAATGGNGSLTSPFKTVTACAAAVTPGHTCWLRAGSYSDLNVAPAQSGTSDTARVTFAAYPGEHPVLDGQRQQGSAFSMWGKNYVTIRGLEITNYVAAAASGYTRGAAIYFNRSAYPVVEKNH